MAVNLAQQYHSVGKIRQEIKHALNDDLSKVDNLALIALNAEQATDASGCIDDKVLHQLC